MSRVLSSSSSIAKLPVLFSVPSILTLALWLTSSLDITIVEILVSFTLLYIPWHAFVSWKRRGKDQLPVFSMVVFMYWLYYAVPVFWGDRLVSDIFDPIGHEIGHEQIIKSEVVVLLGVICLWAGFKIRVPEIVSSERLKLPFSERRWYYLRTVLIASSLLTLADPSASMLGDTGRQLLSLATTAIPMVVFAVLFRQFIRGESQLIDKALIGIFLFLRLLLALSSGMLGSFGSVVIVSAAVFMSERRKIPWVAAVVVVLFVLFFQPGKSDFRDIYWKEKVHAPVSDRVSFWVNESWRKWEEGLLDETGETRKQLLSQSLSRVSLLTATSNVLEKTPSDVPYQYGRLYSYLLVTFVPRFIWPAKPSVNEANQFYQLAYGVSDEEQLKTVSISIGVLVEGYINFGWFGVAGIMFLLGILLRSYQRAFLSQHPGTLMSAIGVVLLPQLLAIEGQMAVYIGGIIQQVIFTFLVMLPVIRIRRVGSQSRPLARSQSATLAST